MNTNSNNEKESLKYDSTVNVFDDEVKDKTERKSTLKPLIDNNETLNKKKSSPVTSPLSTKISNEK